MNKNVLIGIIAFGGLLLVSALLSGTSEDSNKISQTEGQGSSISLPENLPTQIPIYPYTEIQNVNESSKDGIEFISISVSAEATKSEVNEWYRKELSLNGWAIQSDRNVAGYQIIQAENDNLFTSMQAASGNSPGTSVISQQIQIRP